MAGVTTVTDTRANSPDGVDTLRGVNVLQFADGYLFQNAAANRTTLGGSSQRYAVSNGEYVIGTNAVEHFVVSSSVSASVSSGAGDTVDLAGTIDSYTFRASGNQLQLSDGVYTIAMTVSGTALTLRTASGSTSVVIDFAAGGVIKLGGTQIVGSATFDPAASILDPLNVSSVQPLPVRLLDGSDVQAQPNRSEIFIVDASEALAADISGYEEGDELLIVNWTEELGVVVENDVLGDGAARVLIGSATLDLTALSSDAFADEQSFENIFGAAAITYVV